MSTTKNFLLKHLDTYHHIQCSNEKSEQYLFKSPGEALDYNYVRFGNTWFIPAISIDIDNKTDFLQVIKDNNLPEPTFIVHTDRGTHLHWFLEVPVATSQPKSLYKLRQLIGYLQGLFGGDKFATTASAGRVWRNPLRHPHYFSGNLVAYSDFVLPEIEKPITRQTTGRSRHAQTLSIDLTKVSKGSRNCTLFDYGAAFAYTTGVLDVSTDLIVANSKLPEPLAPAEVASISSSINSFMANKYRKGNYKASDKLVAFNRKVASKQADKKFDEIFNKLVISIAPIFMASRLSARKASTVLKISKNTWTKHRGALMSKLVSLVHTLKKPLSVFSIDNPDFSYYLPSFNLNSYKIVSVYNKGPT